MLQMKEGIIMGGKKRRKSCETQWQMNRLG